MLWWLRHREDTWIDGLIGMIVDEVVVVVPVSACSRADLLVDVTKYPPKDQVKLKHGSSAQNTLGV